MRYVKVSQDEFASVRKLYESVMAYACHGLFFREGQSIADGVAKEVERGEDLFVGARRGLIARGWIRDVPSCRAEPRGHAVLRDDLRHDVPLRDDPDRGVPLHDDQAPDAPVPHRRRRLVHGQVRRRGHGVLRHQLEDRHPRALHGPRIRPVR